MRRKGKRRPERNQSSQLVTDIGKSGKEGGVERMTPMTAWVVGPSSGLAEVEKQRFACVHVRDS